MAFLLEHLAQVHADQRFVLGDQYAHTLSLVPLVVVSASAGASGTLMVMLVPPSWLVVSDAAQVLLDQRAHDREPEALASCQVHVRGQPAPVVAHD